VGSSSNSILASPFLKKAPANPTSWIYPCDST